MSKISVVVPVYNSEDTLIELHKRIRDVFHSLNSGFELILVDDSSTDKSWEIISQLKSDFPTEINGVKLSKNAGQHNALLCGFHFCKGEYVITMDDDLQHPPEEISKLIQQQRQTDAEVVYGIYKESKHSKVRNFASAFAKKTSVYFSENKTGKGSPFRLLSAGIAEKIRLSGHQFVYMDEIIHWFTSEVSFVEVDHHPRKSGRSSYGPFKLFSLYIQLMINYTALPLKLMTYGGLILSVISFSFGVFFLIKKIYFNVPVPGYTSLIVAILFSSSLMFICFGIIGQYLYRIYQKQNGKPPYSIRKII